MATAADKAGTTTDILDEDPWAALAAETDEFIEWSEDPLQDLDLAPQSMTVWSVSARAGAGHSSNFLKREFAQSSRYLQIEGDIFINTLFENASLTSLLFFEHTEYDQNGQADSESIVFLHANWSVFRDLWTWGIDLDAFYGDQIYDASLTNVSAPIGANLRQVRPELTVFVERMLGSRDMLRSELSLLRAAYEEAEEDYWRPAFSVEWVRNWNSALETSTEASLYMEIYDEDIARQAGGLPLDPETELEIYGLRLQEVLTWKPVKWPSFKSTLRAGALLESEREGRYESALRLFSSLSLSWKSDWIDLRMDGRWQNVRYADRHSDFADTRPLHQTYRSLRIEAKRDLVWNTSLEIGVEWSDFGSRSSSEVFSERRAEVLIEWSY